MGKVNYKILLVDNDEMSLKSLDSFLISEGYSVSSFLSPNDALNSVRKQKYQFVLTDYSMLEMSGVQLIQKLKEIDPNICAILYTGYASQLIEQQEHFKNVNYFFKKPLRIRQLISILNNSKNKQTKEKK